MPKRPLISIVDDDAAVRNATKTLIRALGYRVATFSSAEEFLSSDRVHDTSCLISDLNMPGMNGLELQDRLATSGQRIPMIFIATVPDDRLRDRAMQAGAISFLSKPYSDANLIVCIDRALKTA